MLKANEVLEEQENRRERRMAAMRPVLAQIYAKIKQQAIHNVDAPYIVSEIPSFVFGYPLYQLLEARDYLTHTLEQSGFLVWVVDEKFLLISWMKRQGGKASYRPQLTTNYRPMPYDPSNIVNMTRK